MPTALKNATSLSTSDKSMEKPANSLWQVMKVASFWALVLFACVNISLWMFANGEKPSTSNLWSGSGSIDLALADFFALKQRPNVVLLGSSLMMYPFWAMDRESDSHIGDIFHHHVSLNFASRLKNAGWKDPQVFSLAIFGQMASDAFIYVNEFLNDKKKPQWLVFGIAPRDFSDYDLPAPMATMTFKRLVGMSNLGRYLFLYLPGWQDKADFVAEHACFFYGKRRRLQQEIDRAIAKVYQTLGLNLADPHVSVKEDKAGFMLSGNEKERWANSVMEYRRRYRNIGQKDLSMQMGFLDKLLEVCQQRDIKVVVLNMPLTAVNRALLPTGFYDYFRKRIGKISNKPGVKFLDLGDASDFKNGDFWDSTHLNHSGGHKLLRHLLPLLTRQG